MPSEKDYKNARDLLSGKQKPMGGSRYKAPPQEARASERAAGTGVSVPGGLLRMPSREEAAGFAGETLPPLVGQALAQRMVGPAASPLLRALAGVTGGALGGGGQAKMAGEDVTRGALTGAAGAALGEAGAIPFGASGRSLLERASAPVGSALRTIGRRTPGVSKLFEMAPGADETIRLLAEEGSGKMPTLGQVSKSNSVIWLESMAQRAIGAHGPLLKTQEAAEESAKGIADRFVKRFMNVDRVRAGELIDDVVKDRLANFRDASSAMYKPVDDALGGEAVPTQALKDAAEKLMGTRIGIRGESAQRLLGAIAELPDTISFTKASAIRSDLLRINRASDELIKGQAGSIATDLHGVLDEEMENVAKGLNPRLAADWRAAQAFYKRGAKDFNDDIIGALSRQEPEDMAEYLFSLDEGKVRRAAIERLRRVAKSYGGGRAGEDDVLEPVRGAFINKMMKQAAGGEGRYGQGSVQFVDGQKLRQMVARFDRSELESLFSQSDARKLADVAQAIEITQKRAKNIIGTSGLPSVVLAQVGGSTVIFNSDQSLPAKAAQIGTIWTLGPRALSWALRDPQVVKMLASNVRTGPPGSGLTAKFASQFTARMLAAQRLFGGDEVKPQRGTLKDQPLSLNDPSRRATTFEETR